MCSWTVFFSSPSLVPARWCKELFRNSFGIPRSSCRKVQNAISGGTPVLAKWNLSCVAWPQQATPLVSWLQWMPMQPIGLLPLRVRSAGPATPLCDTHISQLGSVTLLRCRHNMHHCWFNHHWCCLTVRFTGGFGGPGLENLFRLLPHKPCRKSTPAHHLCMSGRCQSDWIRVLPQSTMQKRFWVPQMKKS